MQTRNAQVEVAARQLPPRTNLTNADCTPGASFLGNPETDIDDLIDGAQPEPTGPAHAGPVATRKAPGKGNGATRATNAPQGDPARRARFNPDNVPAELKASPQWVVYITKQRDGKPGKTDKIPVGADGEHLINWANRALSYTDALKRLRQLPNASGLGIVIPPGGNIVGTDLDGCLDATGKPTREAAEVIQQLHSYTEVSPSGKGIRIINLGSIADDWQTARDGSALQLEVYNGHRARFLTITGDRLPDAPTTVNEAPAGLQWLAQAFPPATRSKAEDRPMPDLVDDAPDIETLGLNHPALQFLQEGKTGADRSRTLQATAKALCRACDDATALSVLVDNPHAWDIAKDHRRQDDDKAMEYLWKHVRDARAAVGPSVRNCVADLFDRIDDLSTNAATIPERDNAPPDPVEPLQPIEYVVEGLIPTGLAYFAGGHGVGKSSLLVSLCTIVTGEARPNPAGPKVTLPRNVVYITEDPRQAESIRRGLQKHHGAALRKGWFKVMQARRLKPEQIVKLVEKIMRTLAYRHPSGYIVYPLVVFDTVNACFDIESENDASDVGQVMNALKQAMGKGAIWLIGHVAKAQLRAAVEDLTGRGSSAWEADAACTAFIAAHPTEDTVRILATRKRRFETDDTELTFQTATGEEVVNTEWGDTQRIRYRYGELHRSSAAERMNAMNEAKREQLVTARDLVLAQIKRRMETFGDQFLHYGPAGGPVAPPGLPAGRSEEDRTKRADHILSNDRMAAIALLPDSQENRDRIRKAVDRAITIERVGKVTFNKKGEEIYWARITGFIG